MTSRDQRRAMRRTQTVRLSMEEWALVLAAMRLLRNMEGLDRHEAAVVVTDDLEEQLGLSPISATT